MQMILSDEICMHKIENMELLGSLMQQIHVSTQSFGVWIPLAFGLVVGLVYVIASAARRSR